MSAKPMREAMPNVAAIVDSLRQQLGPEWANRILRQQGGCWCYAFELGNDGVLREFGARPDGARAQLVDGQLVPPPKPKGIEPALSSATYAHLLKPKERERG